MPRGLFTSKACIEKVGYRAHTEQFVFVSNVFNMVMYADDTTLFCNMDNTVDEHVINNELCKICEWLGANKLSLNISKTKFMVFHTSNRSVTYPVLQLDRRPIERVAQFNFFGLILQSNLAWSKHINHVSLKIYKTIGILYRWKAIYPSAILQTLYNPLILPFLNLYSTKHRNNLNI